MITHRMTDHEWMEHMRGRLRGLQVLCIVAIASALVAWALS